MCQAYDCQAAEMATVVGNAFISNNKKNWQIANKSKTAYNTQVRGTGTQTGDDQTEYDRVRKNQKP